MFVAIALALLQGLFALAGFESPRESPIEPARQRQDRCLFATNRLRWPAIVIACRPGILDVGH